MRLLKFSLIISFFGVLFLIILSLNVEPKEVFSYAELEEGVYVIVSGKVVSIREYGEFKTVKFDNNISFNCNGCGIRENLRLRVEGKVSEYRGKMQVNAERIFVESKQ